MKSTKEVLEQAKEDGVKKVELQFSSLFGKPQNLTIPVSKLEDALEEGVWFDGSSIDGFTAIHESDMLLSLDTDTYSILPWVEESTVVRFICDIMNPDGTPYECDSRQILKKAVQGAREAGFDYLIGPEPEFFLLKRKECGTLVPGDNIGYFECDNGLGRKIRREIKHAATEMGIDIEALHHEVAPGQHEINFRYDSALKMADTVFTYKQLVKHVASKHGLVATFMPKPFAGENGSGMHTHQSLFTKDGQNAFYDGTDEHNLSAVAKSFIAGQLKYMKELSSVIAPSVNSYKRLVPGYEAPVNICWAPRNRSALIRIPRIPKGKEKGARCELRCPDPSGNPYLQFAAMLAAGMEGVTNGLTAPEPVLANTYKFSESDLKERGIETLPATLGEAMYHLKESTVLRKAFGDAAFDNYVEGKQKEWDDFRLMVSPWELDTYLHT